MLVATSGDSLGAPDVVEAMKRHLFALANVITPNTSEAMRLADVSSEPQNAADLGTLARALHALGARAVLVKGGHLTGDDAPDVLFDGAKLETFNGPRIETRNTHGTGCTLSSAIAAHLARGFSLKTAIAVAKDYLTDSLAASDELSVGSGEGHGPVHHFHNLWP